MNSLDPLSEIVSSGQAFSSSIVLERILWIMMAFFFLGAISKSITKGMKQNNRLRNNSFLSNFKTFKEEDKLTNNLSDQEK